MPEGDTIHNAAKRIGSALVGKEIVSIETPQSRQAGQTGAALLAQRNGGGIGNIWKSEGCFLAGVDPGRRVDDVTDAEALAIVRAVRPRMRSSADGTGVPETSIYNRAGRPCPRC